MDKLCKLADMIGSSGDHNSREYAGILLNLFGKTPIKRIYRFWIIARPIIKQYNPKIFIPTRTYFGCSREEWNEVLILSAWLLSLAKREEVNEKELILCLGEQINNPQEDSQP